MTTYTIKRGDTRPSPLAQLIDGAGNPVDLTGATARFKARLSLAEPLKIDAAAVVEPGTDGWVRYDPVVADTDVVADYLAEWQVTFAGGSIITWPADGFDELRVTADLDEPVSADGAGYATRAQARNAGATGTDAQIDTALAAARTRIDRFTDQTWRERVETVVARVSHEGIALLPRQIDTSEPIAVRYVGASYDVPTTAYQVTSSRQQGQIDAVYLGAGGSDILINGAEPYNGGWRNLLPTQRRIAVTGTFGTAEVPQEVAAAAALIAAAITQGGGLAGARMHAPDVDDEGNTVAIETSDDEPAEPAVRRTTGVAAADELLLSLRHRVVRVS